MQVPATYDQEPFVSEPVQNDNSTVSPQASRLPVSEAESRKANVRQWIKKIKAAKVKWQPDFQRMRDNMNFAAGFQWEQQVKIDDKRYIANQIVSNVQQKVAALFARDPRVEYVRRPRLDYVLWDEKLETLLDCVMRVQANPNDMEAQATLQDYEQGNQWKQTVEKVGRTLEILFGYQLEAQTPNFKLQFKQLIRRVVTCGVGYIKLGFERDQVPQLTESQTDNGMIERVRRAKRILQRLEDGELDKDSPEVDELSNLMQSVHSDVVDGTEEYEPQEQLVIDFPSATSIIPDPSTKVLKGWVGASWLAQEYILPIEEINAFFECKITPKSQSGDVIEYGSDGTAFTAEAPTGQSDGVTNQPMGCLWRVENMTDGMEFFIVDGHEDFVLEPMPLQPDIKRFWTIIPLTFNDVESEEDGKYSTIFPPSDVQLMKPAQKEWNRTREALREHRKANAPMMVTTKGSLSDPDKQKLTNAVPNELVELDNLPSGTDISKVLFVLQRPPLDPALYDTEPAADDLVRTVGSQISNAENIGTQETATGAQIKEQGRMTVASSNVDDVDECLTELAFAGGEILLKEMSQATVQRIVGRGASWPSQNRQDYCNEIFLQVQAGSSGRPNKAMEVQNMTQLTPMLVQAGADPQFIIRELVKRLDDKLDPSEAFPIQRVMSQEQQKQQPQESLSESIAIKLADLSVQERAQALQHAGIQAGGEIPKPQEPTGVSTAGSASRPSKTSQVQKPQSASRPQGSAMFAGR